MTHQSPPAAPAGADPGGQLSRLRDLLRLIEQVAERHPGPPDARLDEAARLSDAYDRAMPIVQRRFDLLAGEVAAWATAGVEALLVAGERGTPRAAAGRLADRLEQALAELSGLLMRETA
jgi:hypothetical protein